MRKPRPLKPKKNVAAKTPGTVHLLLPSVVGGGLQKWVTLVADELDKKGWKFVFVSADAPGTPPSFPSQTGIPLTALNCPMGGSLLGKLKFLFCFAKTLAAYVKTEKPTLIVLAGKEMGLAALLARFFGAKGFSTCFLSVSPTSAHLEKMPCLRRKVLEIIYGAIHRRAHSLVAQTEDDATHLHKAFGVPRHAIFVSPPPLTARFLEEPLTPKPRREFREILYVGRFSAEKNLHHLITAFAGLNPTENEFHLHLLGDGPQKPMLRQLVAEMGLETVTTFTPFDADTYAHFARADVLALTSSFEGFGMVLAEGMAAGTPAVAYDCPFGPRAVIQEGKNGFLCPLEDIGALQTALQAALEKRWDSKALRDSVKKFSVQNVAVEFEKALFKALDFASQPNKKR